ncbi:MAG: hypothetical protein H6732_11595 [Alphaproteobacteria bacterium]|nr:hypothetical protein [Alphaproteobacteria bacterium]
MTTPFTTWDARVRGARDERARRTLLGEVGLWRAQHLTDLPAQREATWALSELHRLLGDRERAAHEAQQLMALCRTAPRPAREVMAEAERHLARLTRPERGGGEQRAAWAGAVEAVREGRFDEARAALAGSRNPKAGLLRVWAKLAEALAQEEPARTQTLQALERELAGRFAEVKAPREEAPRSQAQPSAPPAAPAEAPVGDRPLALLLDGPVPRRREPLLKAIDRLLAADPSKADAVAAAALRDHVGQHGEKAVAPWLIGLSVRALATTDGVATREAIAALGEAYAVTAYRETPFERLAAVHRAAEAAGMGPHGARRGLLRHGEPDDRVAWTLRVLAPEGEAMVSLLPAVDAPWADGVPARIVARLVELSPRGVVAAPGPHHEALREAAAAAGLVALDTDEAAPVVEALAALPAPEPPAPPPPDPAEQLRTLFEADPPSPEEAYAEPLAAQARAYKALVAVRGPLHARTPAEADVRMAPFLRAVHASAPAGVRLVEGVSEAVRLAAMVPGGAVDALLRAGDAAAARYGAPGVLPLVGLLSPAVAEGWSVGRVLLGITRGEERARPALAPLGKAVRGLVRVRLRRGDVEGEVWWLDEPSAEAQMALPLLLLAPGARVLVAASGQGIEGWLSPDAGTPLLLWPDAGAPALVDALAAWTPSEAGPAEDEEAP